MNIGGPDLTYHMICDSLFCSSSRGEKVFQADWASVFSSGVTAFALHSVDDSLVGVGWVPSSVCSSLELDRLRQRLGCGSYGMSSKAGACAQSYGLSNKFSSA